MTAPAVNSVGNAAAIATRNPKSVLGKDEFLKLLVAQLKHQDPTNPMDGQQMAAQLAQFSSVEQLIDINGKLAEQAQTDGLTAVAISNSTAMNAIGRDVSATGNQVELVPGEERRLRAVVDGTGQGTLTLYNANGVEVGRRDLGTVRAGDQEFSLGGLELGQPAGTYTWRLDVTSADRRQVPVTQFTTGRVTGVEFTAGGAVLVAGRLRIPVGAVVHIGSR